MTPTEFARLYTRQTRPMLRLKLMHALTCEHMEELHAQVQRAVQWNRNLRTLQENGQIRVIIHYRDCDCVEGYTTYVCPVSQVNARVQSDLDWADGPMVHSLARPSDVPRFPRSRDRILEAFENGRSYSV